MLMHVGDIIGGSGEWNGGHWPTNGRVRCRLRRSGCRVRYFFVSLAVVFYWLAGAASNPSKGSRFIMYRLTMGRTVLSSADRPTATAAEPSVMVGQMSAVLLGKSTENQILSK